MLSGERTTRARRVGFPRVCLRREKDGGRWGEVNRGERQKKSFGERAEPYEPPSRPQLRISYPLVRTLSLRQIPVLSITDDSWRAIAPTNERTLSAEKKKQVRAKNGLRERLLHDPTALYAAPRLVLQRHGQYTWDCRESGMKYVLIMFCWMALTSSKSPV